MFIPQTKDSEENNPGDPEPENGQDTNETQKTSQASGEGRKERIKIRNRSYKVRRYLAQPKNINVKQNGRVFKRMVVRRQKIYPSTRRRQEY